MSKRRDERFEQRRFEERWRDIPYRRSEGEQGRYSSHYNPEHYGEHMHEQHSGEPEWQRERSEEHWGSRGDYPRYGRSFEQGPSAQREEFRDRPYSTTSSYSGRGGYEGHLDPYRESRERGYGATGSGVGWGSVETGGHRLGSLTRSAGESAQHLFGRHQEYGERAYGSEDPQRISYAGRGPKGYKRSDERIREEVCEVLTRHPDVDATNIEVTVNEGMVVLSGAVDERRAKRIAEDVVQDISGVRDVQNQIRVQQPAMMEQRGTAEPESARAQTAGSVLGLSAEAGGRR
jgi:osmotically-inducible protein OsmY